jgi:hypothetical protein
MVSDSPINYKKETVNLLADYDEKRCVAHRDDCAERFDRDYDKSSDIGQQVFANAMRLANYHREPM